MKVQYIIQKVQEALREHATAVRDPLIIHPVNVSSATDKAYHKGAESTAAIWQKIYTNPELYKSVVFFIALCF